MPSVTVVRLTRVPLGLVLRLSPLDLHWFTSDSDHRRAVIGTPVRAPMSWLASPAMQAGPQLRTQHERRFRSRCLFEVHPRRTTSDLQALLSVVQDRPIARDLVKKRQYCVGAGTWEPEVETLKWSGGVGLEHFRVEACAVKVDGQR